MIDEVNSAAQQTAEMTFRVQELWGSYLESSPHVLELERNAMAAEDTLALRIREQETLKKHVAAFDEILGGEAMSRLVDEFVPQTKPLESEKIQVQVWRNPKVLNHRLKQQITSVSAGVNHVVVITRGGELYEWGTLMPSTGISPIPQKIEFPHNHILLKVACGAYHTVATTIQKQLYTWGAGQSGQLGHGSHRDEVAPKMVRALERKKIILVECGFSHTGVVTSQGVLYLFGLGSSGQLGHGSKANLSMPKPLKLGEAVARVACGATHTLVATASGVLHSMGNGSHGELGVNETSSLLPKRVHLETNVVQVACGYRHSAAITEHGEQRMVWVWGCYGPMNVVETDADISESCDVPCWRPQCVDSLSSEKIIALSSGVYHTVALSQRGKCFTWGHNGHMQVQPDGCTEVCSSQSGLGLGSEEEVVAHHVRNGSAMQQSTTPTNIDIMPPSERSESVESTASFVMPTFGSPLPQKESNPNPENRRPQDSLRPNIGSIQPSSKQSPSMEAVLEEFTMKPESSSSGAVLRSQVAQVADVTAYHISVPSSNQSHRLIAVTASPYGSLVIDIEGQCYRWGNTGPVIHGIASEHSALLVNRVMRVIQKVARGFVGRRKARNRKEAVTQSSPLGL